MFQFTAQVRLPLLFIPAFEFDDVEEGWRISITYHLINLTPPGNDIFLKYWTTSYYMCVWIKICKFHTIYKKNVQADLLTVYTVWIEQNKMYLASWP